MHIQHQSSALSLLAFVAVCVAAVGYFVGLQSPMNPGTSSAENRAAKAKNGLLVSQQRESKFGAAVPATHYADMHRVTNSRGSKSSIAELANFDLMAEIQITPDQKAIALRNRALNRAFNGAPPTIPHPIDQMSDSSCVACHGEGAKTESLRIPQMSHQFLTSCTQCHVENDPSHMPSSQYRENSFVGLSAPTGGSRAYAGAPPTIPHSTWMRVNCTSCHGLTGGHGIRTTHPWRQSCQQCHAPSATLVRMEPETVPGFLPPMEIEP